MRPTCRGLLTSLAVALAGCTGLGGGGEPVSETPTATEPHPEEATATETATSGSPTMTDDTTPEGELDLREANVTRVELSRSGTSVSFDVTLFHDVRKSPRDFRSPSEREAF